MIRRRLARLVLGSCLPERIIGYSTAGPEEWEEAAAIGFRLILVAETGRSWHQENSAGVPSRKKATAEV